MEEIKPVMELYNNYTNEGLQNIIDKFSKCKIEYINAKEEVKGLREANTKLKTELNEALEIVKSQNCHLQNTRNMIATLQETVSQLVYLKTDAKRLSEEIISKDSIIISLEKDKETMAKKQNEALLELRMSHGAQIEEIKIENECKIRQAQHAADTQVAQFMCANEELKSQLNEMGADHRDKINLIVLEYEEKIQRSAAQYAQLQDQLSRQSATAQATTDAYRLKIEELEEKLKQYEFKEYLDQNQHYNSMAERPYSVSGETYTNNKSITLNSTPGCSKQLPRVVTNRTNVPKATNTLQVTYSGGVNPTAAISNDNKGQFKIKRNVNCSLKTTFRIINSL